MEFSVFLIGTPRGERESNQETVRAERFASGA
jgi:hypothetical protein